MNGRRLLNETPTVVGMITSALQSGGSIDTAIRQISSEGPKLSRDLFLEAVRLTDSKGSTSLVEALSSKMECIPKEASGYGRALLITFSAAESSDDDTRDGMLKDAAEIAIESIKEAGEAYGSSLTIPSMVIFGIGIMVPMILMSIIPLLEVGGMFGNSILNQNMIIAITLVIIPCAILMTALYIRNINPFLSEENVMNSLTKAFPLIVSLPLSLMIAYILSDMDHLLIITLVPACVLTSIMLYKSIKEEAERKKNELSLMDSVFDIGNRMISGFNFERASVEAIASKESCYDISVNLEKEYALCRGSVRNAIIEAVGPISHEVGVTLSDISLCAERSPEDASRLAITMGGLMQNRNITKKNIASKLKSTTDMMVGTAMIFAPLVLGMSISMLEPISALYGNVSFAGASIILQIYLIELSALIAILVSCLGDDDRAEHIIWRFCMMCPIALIVFRVCSSISF